MLIEPGGLRTGIWDKAADALRRKRRGSASPKACDRSLEVLETARPRVGARSAAAKAIGDALTAGHPMAHYRVAVTLRSWRWSTG